MLNITVYLDDLLYICICIFYSQIFSQFKQASKQTNKKTLYSKNSLLITFFFQGFINTSYF
jgi:hypothetical protein